MSSYRAPLLVSASATFALLAACREPNTASNNAAFVVENPSGTCEAEGNGDRAGYHASAGLVWVPDCQNPRAREYWRVFASDPQHAAMIPRPDGAAELQDACTDGTHTLHAIVAHYGLCRSASSSAEVDRVNRMAIGDALLVARELHRQMRFTVRERLSPYAPPTDILDACALRAEAAVPELASMCQRERERLESGNDIGYSYEGPGAVELAKRLNELYGVEASTELPCVRYADGVCDAAAQCGAWKMERVVCGGSCEPLAKSYTYCVRGGSANVACLAEVASGDLYISRGGGAPDDPENFRACTEEEHAAFQAATN